MHWYMIPLGLLLVGLGWIGHKLLGKKRPFQEAVQRETTQRLPSVVD
jgi:hypothetical protein